MPAKKTVKKAIIKKTPAKKTSAKKAPVKKTSAKIFLTLEIKIKELISE